MTSRRDFIRTIVLASGSIYTLELIGCGQGARPVARTYPSVTQRQRTAIAHKLRQQSLVLPTPARQQRTDVAIVGSGMAGLTAAMHLQQQGYQVTILESEPRSGGAAVRQRVGTSDVSLGSVYFVDMTQDVRDVLSYAGVEAIPVGDDAYVVGGETYTDFWSDAQLRRAAASAAEADAMRRFRDTVLALGDAFPAYPLADALSDHVRQLDATSARAYIAPYNSPLLTSVLDAYCRSSMGGNLDDVNAHCLLNFYSAEFGASFGGERYTVMGGPSSIARGLAARTTIQHDECVLRIAQEGSGVQIDSMRPDGSVTRTTARTVIVAAPKFVASRIVQGLPDVQRNAMQQLQYAPYMTVHVASTGSMLSTPAFDTWHIPATETYTDIVSAPQPARRPGSTHVCSIYAPLRRTERATALDDDAMAQRVGHIMADMLVHAPVGAADGITEIYAWAWGHGIVIPTVGSHLQASLHVRRPHGRVVFAGTDNDASPAIENAIASGIRSAADVLRLLRS
ncbi:MAG: FAD-dependent oxidoreductase [Candidatus Kapabacteria bacterium]|nr:FAD-dependent oxidoreductase [Candidatus Kapabacteria bacterium]